MSNATHSADISLTLEIDKQSVSPDQLCGNEILLDLNKTLKAKLTIQIDKNTYVQEFYISKLIMGGKVR